MDKLIHNDVEFEVHHDRMRELFDLGIVERYQTNTYKLHPGLGEGQRKLVEALLDLQGDWL